MSTADLTFDLPPANSVSALHPAVRVVQRDFRPWGFWGSLGWGLLAVATGLFGCIVYMLVWMLTHQLQSPNQEDASFGTVLGIVALVVSTIVIGIAARSRGGSLRHYFALESIRRRDLILGSACLAVLILIFEAVEQLLGIDGGSKSVEETYRAVKLAGALPLLWLATIAVAPITEELMFRGFLHRGWTTSWIGVWATILLTSALWAALHQQYNWLGILCIFLMGLIFGWIRQRSGSTTLTIVLHSLNNLIAMILVTVHVEWLS